MIALFSVVLEALTKIAIVAEDPGRAVKHKRQRNDRRALLMMESRPTVHGPQNLPGLDRTLFVLFSRLNSGLYRDGDTSIADPCHRLENSFQTNRDN